METEKLYRLIGLQPQVIRELETVSEQISLLLRGGTVGAARGVIKAV